MFKYYKQKPVQIHERLQACGSEEDGDYSLSGVSMRVWDWPRGDGCHKPDTTLRDAEGKVVTYSNELHTAYEHNHKFDEYSFDCVEGVSET